MRPPDREPARPSGAEPALEGRAARIVGLCLLAALLGFGVWMRVHFALADRNFDAQDPSGMLRTDPALLHYVGERIAAAGGGLPADLRSDPRIEFPETTDWLAIETVGQEFVVAWAKLWLAPATPLHVVATWVMAFFASLCVVGVYGLAWELTRRVKWAVLAALAWSVLPASYRTIGFVLVREDFSLPWFALHLWLFARALRLRTPGAGLLATAALGLFVSTWHAATFLFALEAALVLAWYLRTGANPLAGRVGACCAGVLALGSLAVPVLRAKGFLASPGMLVVWTLLVLGLLERRQAKPALVRVALALGGAAALALVLHFAGLGSGDFSHVFELLRAKLACLGQRPDDPGQLSFEARLLWVGPFRTGELDDLRYGYPLAAVAVVLAALVFARDAWRGTGDARAVVLAALGLTGLVLALAIQRLYVLPGLVGPVLAALVASRWRGGGPLLAAGIAAEALFLGFFYSRFFILWYTPDGRVEEQARLMQWIEREVPAGEAIASDYENSAAILAVTGHPVLLQPKYETRRSRERIEELYTALFRGGTEELRALLRERYHCRYLVVDRMTLRFVMAYAGGLADNAPPARGSAFARFFSEDPRAFAEIPGFRLLYRSQPRPRLPELYRVYRLD